MTWVDWLIGGVFVVFIYRGFRKGFVQQFFDLLGSVVALVLAFYFYQRFGAFLAKNLSCSTPLANLLGFVLIVVLIGGTVSFIGKQWRQNRTDEPVILIDGGFGALLGGLKAAVILMVVLLVVLAIPWEFMHKPVKESGFASDLLRLAPLFYVIQDHSLPADFPRLLVSPEGLQLRGVDEQKLEGATCIYCGANVKYLGLVRQGISYYPKVICPNCHRTSDGCLTFEGYHMIYGVCPYERLGSMGVIDCKVWPNTEPTSVHGRCPVCGRSQ